MSTQTTKAPQSGLRDLGLELVPVITQIRIAEIGNAIKLSADLAAGLVRPALPTYSQILKMSYSQRLQAYRVGLLAAGKLLGELADQLVAKEDKQK